MKNIIKILLIALFAIPSFGQSISIFDIDTTNFPTMNAKFYALDQDGKQQRPSASEITISENGINRTITNVSCPAKETPRALSSVLAIDVSGSMSEKRNYKVPFIELAKIASLSWIKALPLGKSECAITSFDNDSYINQDFTKDRNKLITAINNLTPQNGTEYDAGLIKPITGALALMKNAKYKKIIVFLTDGFGKGSQTQIVQEANNSNCKIYSITLGLKAPDILKNISKNTGGDYFENVTTIEEAKSIYLRILSIEQEISPCSIEWEGLPNCGENKRICEFLYGGGFTNEEYNKNSTSDYSLKLSSNCLNFGEVNPGNEKVMELVLTAIGKDYKVNSITNLSTNLSLFIENISFPIEVKKDKEVKFNIRYAPKDINYNISNFLISTNDCQYYFSTTSGFRNSSNNSVNNLKITKPRNGEKYITSTDSIIQWEGINLDVPVSVNYSFDNGKNWINLAEKVKGKEYYWYNIPKPNSDSALIKIIPDNFYFQDSMIFVKDEPIPKVVSMLLTKDGKNLFIASNDPNNIGKIRIYNAESGELIKELIHSTPINEIAINEDGKVLVSHGGAEVAVWDIDNGKVRNYISVGSLPSNYLAVSNDGKYLAISSLSQIRIIQIDNSLIKSTIIPNSLIIKISSNDNMSYISTVNSDNTVRIYVTSSGNEVQKIYDNTIRILDAKLSKSGKLIFVVSDNKTVRVYDTFGGNGGALLKTMAAHKYLITSIDLSKDNKYLVTGSTDQTAVIWDLYNYTSVKTLYNNYSISKVAISDNGSKIATYDESAQYLNNVRIYNREYIEYIKPAISDSVFSIVSPTPFSKDIDMQQCIIGNIKDSVINDAIINNGNYKFSTDSIYFTGNDANSFSLISGFPPNEIAPNTSSLAEIQFKPIKIGIHSANINIIAGGDTLINKITGEGVSPQLEIVNNLIDFGSVDIGQTKDTIQVVTIKNVGSVALNVNSSLHLGPNDIDFTTSSGAAPFSLNAGESAKMNLRFKPTKIGRTSGRLQFEFNGAGSPATVQLFGTGLGGTATINIGSDTTYTNEEVEIPVNILANNKLLNSGVTAISFEIELNKNILFPVGVNSTIDGENRIIKFDNVPIKNVGVNEVAKLKFIATLGNAEETTIRVRNIIPIGNDADFDVIDGNFKLLGVCKEGGDRFLSSSLSQTKLLTIAPNPAAESIEIEYSNADEGEAEIIISNLLGQTILTQKLVKTQTGFTKLDLSQIPTGQYSILFKTETVLENKIIQIIK